MNNANLIIYKQPSLYKILNELDQDLNFQIIYVQNGEDLKKKIGLLDNYVVIARKKISDVTNLIILDSYPIKIHKLLEHINIEFMKQHFNNYSKIKINNYSIDLNSREICFNDIKLKLTEKEVNTIVYLSKKNVPVTIEELEKNVWLYQSDIETHTVETHIYRLRQKILKTFKDETFILSKKNGYQIK
tara:strand:- start:2086 stop:2649 length:564 start_codon:yes stop_codon:yes gene_type:complete